MEEEEEMTDNQKNVRDAAILGVAAHQAPRRLLGYHVVRHGTTKDSAKQIKKTGLRTQYGGTGRGASGSTHVTPDERRVMTENSRGKVYFTKGPVHANAYAFTTGHKTPDKANFGEALRGLATGRPGKVVKARITDRQYRTAKKDAEYGSQFSKRDAAHSNHSIPSRQIIGGAGSKGIRSVINKNTLKSYIKKNPGRFLRGAALAGAGVTAGTSLINRVKRQAHER